MRHDIVRTSSPSEKNLVEKASNRNHEHQKMRHGTAMRVIRVPTTWRTDTYRPYRTVNVEIANLALQVL
ncbi:hypothetical protein GW17_00038387 [Ensete ventricosum]|nr:hypothetical protein GW17_00038387 [Ensete ventricosum]